MNAAATHNDRHTAKTGAFDVRASLSLLLSLRLLP